MFFKEKRGQIFLIATLIIIVLIFSLSTTYNYVHAPVSSKINAQELGNALKYEGVQLINQGVYNNYSSNLIYTNLKNLTSLYSNSQPSFDITMIFGYSENQSSFNYTSYKRGLEETTVLQPAIDLQNRIITLNLNNSVFILNITKGYNFFVLVNQNNQNEKFIIIR